jgi:RNA exonuclease 1
MDSVIDALKTHFFVFGRMSEFSRALGWTDLPSASLDADVSTDATPPQSAIDNLDKQITKLTTSLPPSTAVVILTGCSDPRRMATLSYKKKAWNSNMRSGKRPGDLNPDVRWTHEEALELDIEAEKVKAGLTFFCVTMA